MVPMPDEPPWIRMVSPALKAAALEHVVPHRHQRLRRGAGLKHRQRSGDRHRLCVLRDAILGVAAARHQRHHLVAELVLLRCRRQARPLRPRSRVRADRSRRAAADRTPERCATSGRLTPAAITLIRISPGPGAGTARVSGTSTSGPPGLLIAMTVICEGIFSMICPWPNARISEKNLISQRRSAWQPVEALRSTEQAHGQSRTTTGRERKSATRSDRISRCFRSRNSPSASRCSRPRSTGCRRRRRAARKKRRFQGDAAKGGTVSWQVVRARHRWLAAAGRRQSSAAAASLGQ